MASVKSDNICCYTKCDWTTGLFGNGDTKQNNYIIDHTWGVPNVKRGGGGDSEWCRRVGRNGMMIYGVFSLIDSSITILQQSWIFAATSTTLGYVNNHIYFAVLSLSCLHQLVYLRLQFALLSYFRNFHLLREK